MTDALGNETQLAYDLVGRKTAMDDPDMGDWSYTYDASANLKTQTDARGLVTTLTYDAESRLTKKAYSHPNTPTAPPFPEVNFTYDTYPAGFCAQDLTSVGQMTQMTDAAGEQRSCFDIRGREIGTRRTVDSVAYDTFRTYNSQDALKLLTYPDGEVVQHNYNAIGQLSGLASNTHGNTFIASTTHAPTQQLGALTLGSSPTVTTTYGYDYRMRLTSTVTGSSPMQNVTITYDDASNVTSSTDTVGGTESAGYTYDELDRLTGMTLNSASSAAYTYDKIGNLLTKTEGASNPTLTLTYPTSGAGVVRPHAATQSTSSSFSRKLVYDENGGMIGSEEQVSGDDYAHNYDGDNRLIAILRSKPDSPQPGGLGFKCVDIGGGGENIDAVDIALVRAQFGNKRGWAGYDFRANLNWNAMAGDASDIAKTRAFFGPDDPENYPEYQCDGEITRYVRDGNGTLLKRAHAPRAGTTVADDSTVYIGGAYEKRTVGTTVTVRKYYSAFGRNIAVREVPGGTGAGSVKFLLSDHLGGTAKTMDSSGNIVDNIKYWPFGTIRSGTPTTTDKLFTGQRQEAAADPAMGLYDYNARLYSTTLGRFLSVDPVVGSVGDPQSWNAYTYTRNNPVRLIDPSGTFFEEPGDSTPAAQQGNVCGEVCRALHLIADAQRWCAVVDCTPKPTELPSAGCGCGVTGEDLDGIGFPPIPGTDFDPTFDPEAWMHNWPEIWDNIGGDSATDAVSDVGGDVINWAKGRASGREGAGQPPSWARGALPKPGEDGKAAAERILKEHYPGQEIKRGPGSEFQRLQKHFDTKVIPRMNAPKPTQLPESKPKQSGTPTP